MKKLLLIFLLIFSFGVYAAGTSKSLPQVGTTSLADDGVTAAKIATDAVTTDEILDGTIAIADEAAATIGASLKVGEVYNLNIVNATSTSTDDSVKVECGGAACSSSNYGLIRLRAAGTGDGTTLYTVTSDVTIDLTGAHWGFGGRGDLADAILRVSAVSNGASLGWCVNFQGGRNVISASGDSTTGTDMDKPEEYLCDSEIASNNPVFDSVFWFKANFDDSGGASEDLWTVQSDDGDLNYGSADGQWQPYNPVFAGFAVTPNITHARFTQYGKTSCVSYKRGVATQSNQTYFRTEMPIKAANTAGNSNVGMVYAGIDNSGNVATAGYIEVTKNSTLANLYKDTAGAAWTNANNKGASFDICYEAL